MGKIHFQKQFMPLGIGCLKTFEDLGFKARFLKSQGLGHIFKGKNPNPVIETFLHFTS